MNLLSPQYIIEIKSFNNPPPQIVQVIESFINVLENNIQKYSWTQVKNYLNLSQNSKKIISLADFRVENLSFKIANKVFADVSMLANIALISLPVSKI